MNNQKILEYKTKTDIPGLYLSQTEVRELDSFMEELVFPLDDLIESKGYNPNSIKYNKFVMAYNQLSENVAKALKPVYDEYRIKYFKAKISQILDQGFNSGQASKIDYDKYISDLHDTLPEEFENAMQELKEEHKEDNK